MNVLADHSKIGHSTDCRSVSAFNGTYSLLKCVYIQGHYQGVLEIRAYQDLKNKQEKQTQHAQTQHALLSLYEMVFNFLF